MSGGAPDDFWELFALYMSAAAITSIVWAKYYSPESTDEIMALNANVVKWFDRMRNPVPSWYLGG